MRRYRSLLLAIVLLAIALRLATFGAVFLNGRTYIDGPDGYYHLHRAQQIVQQWPAVPQVDAFLNAPYGGRVSWPPLFDWLLATLALPFGGTKHALELAGAWLPPLLGVAHVLLVAAIVRRVAGEAASLVAALVAAVLPGAVRYAMIGALDHDPFFELMLLVSMAALVDVATREGTSRRASILLAASLAAGTLGWAGAPLQSGIVAIASIVVAVVRRERARDIGSAVAIGGAVAAIVVFPFVITSVWTKTDGVTFEGLSLLHEAALLVLALTGSAIAVFAGGTARRSRAPLVIGVTSAFALVPIAPQSIEWFVRGFRYASGDADILALVAEARPLYSLFGEFDLRPVVVRIGLVAVFVVVGFGYALWRYVRAEGVPTRLQDGEREEQSESDVALGRPYGGAEGSRESDVALGRPYAAGLAVVVPWVAVALFLAMRHSRFTFTAALALAAATGVAYVATPARWRAVALSIALLPALPAYVPVAGFEGLNLVRRGSQVEQFEIDRLGEAIRARGGQGAVLAPWGFGHWILWYAERPVVLSPMLSVGQSGFREGMAAFFIEDVDAAMRFCREHGVRWIVVAPELASIERRARIAGVDWSRYRAENGVPDLRAYMRTVAARLAYFGPKPLRVRGEELPAIPVREIARSNTGVPGPFGMVPVLRVYEIPPPDGN